MRKVPETRKRSRSEASTFSKRWDLFSLITFRMPTFFGLQDLDRTRVVRQVTVNETVEAEKLRVGRLRGHSNVFEVMGPFLLDQVFEDADVFDFRKLDSRRLVRLIAVNEAVEAEKSQTRRRT
jgi:hypothetical protein